MYGGTLVYKSEPKTCSYKKEVLDVSDQNRIECAWNAVVRNSVFDTRFITWEWTFDWNHLKNLGCDSLAGTIIVTSPNSDFYPCAFDEVKLTQPNQTICRAVPCNTWEPQATFEYWLTPRYTPFQEVFHEELFAPSIHNDTILVVNGKKLHVNEMFLSFHSEFFRGFFSSNNEEGKIHELLIEDFSYEDFRLLLSTVYPETPFDETAKKLYHLICNTEIAKEKLMPDKNGMKELLEKTVREVNTTEKAKLLKMILPSVVFNQNVSIV